MLHNISVCVIKIEIDSPTSEEPGNYEMETFLQKLLDFSFIYFCFVKKKPVPFHRNIPIIRVSKKNVNVIVA